MKTNNKRRLRQLDHFKYIGQQLVDKHGEAIFHTSKQALALVALIKGSKRGITRLNLIRKINAANISKEKGEVVLHNHEVNLIEKGWIEVDYEGRKPEIGQYDFKEELVCSKRGGAMVK